MAQRARHLNGLLDGLLNAGDFAVPEQFLDRQSFFEFINQNYLNIIRQTVSQEHDFQFMEEDEIEDGVEDQKLESLITHSVCARTSDADSQDIHQTVDLETVPPTFWSSVGYKEDDFTEFLVYQVHQPACIVHEVTLKVYRATFQPGAPIYPPKYIQIGVGHTPKSLSLSPKFKVMRSAKPQVFSLRDIGMSMAGPYLVVLLHGASAKQCEDRLYYHAIEYVTARGEKCTSPARVTLLQELRAERDVDSFRAAALLTRAGES